MKFLFWQFGSYAVAAFALGFGAAWSWFRERVRTLEASLERSRSRAADSHDARVQLQTARTSEREATEALIVLKARFEESEMLRSAADVDVESLRSTRLKLLTEISELRGQLDASTVSAARLTASEHEATRLRAQLNSADEQLKSERAAREQTMALLQGRLLAAETLLASHRLVAGSETPSPAAEPTRPPVSPNGKAPQVIVDLRHASDLTRQSSDRAADV